MKEYIDKYLASIGPEREHILRNFLQAQLNRHWLELYYPEKKSETLTKIRNPDGKVA
jgi:hypothetical protein